MNRRDFLTLVTAAPIAALAPWPHFLNTPKLAFHPKAFEMAMAPMDLPPGVFLVPKWAIVQRPAFSCRIKG